MTGRTTQRVYEQMLARADATGIQVRWHKGNVLYVSGAQGKQPNSKVTHTKHGFVCGCETFMQDGYCVHAAVARREVIKESQAIAEQRQREGW
jgi:hypothetical protein